MFSFICSHAAIRTSRERTVLQGKKFYCCVDLLPCSSRIFLNILYCVCLTWFKNLASNCEFNSLAGQEDFLVEYGPKFDQELEKLLWEFLLRLDRLLPIPSLAQVVCTFDFYKWSKLISFGWIEIILKVILYVNNLSSDCVVAQWHSTCAGGMCTFSHPTPAPEGSASASDLSGSLRDAR